VVTGGRNWGRALMLSAGLAGWVIVVAAVVVGLGFAAAVLIF
jgi:hypothetical protein